MKKFNYFQRRELIRQIAVNLAKSEGWEIVNEVDILEANHHKLQRYLSLAITAVNTMENFTG